MKKAIFAALLVLVFSTPVLAQTWRTPAGPLAAQVHLIPLRINQGTHSWTLNCIRTNPNTGLSFPCQRLEITDSNLSGWQFQRFIHVHEATPNSVGYNMFYNLIRGFNGHYYIAYVRFDGSWSPYELVGH